MREIKFRAWIKRKIHNHYNEAHKKTKEKFGEHFDYYKGDEYENFDEWYKAERKYWEQIVDDFKGEKISFKSEMIFSGFEINENGIFCNRPFIESVEIMQSTGLLDKEGKEIFEGDIVECDYIGATYNKQGNNTFRGEIIFNKGAFYIKKGSYGKITHILVSNNLIKIKIIGNIYQDKNLIT